MPLESIILRKEEKSAEPRVYIEEKKECKPQAVMHTGERDVKGLAGRIHNEAKQEQTKKQ